MAKIIDGISNVCIFQWKIENIIHCWLKEGKMIKSPGFIADSVQGMKWVLQLYPSSYYTKGSIAVGLNRAVDCVGPDCVLAYFEIAIMDKAGTFLQERIQSNLFFWKKKCAFSDCTKRGNGFVTQRELFLPKDTLTVQCAIWNTDQKPSKTLQLFARTAFRVNRRNSMCRFEDFGSLKCDQKHTFKESLIEFDLALKDGLEFGKNLIINIISLDESIKYFSFKICIIDSGGKKENCVTQEYFEGDLKKGVLYTWLFAKKLMENKRKYLPNDVLSLDCEYVYSNGTVSHEHYGCAIITSKLTKELQNAESRNEHQIDIEKPETIAIITKDLKFMYDDRIFSDVEIRSPTQTFPAHKNILSARSPVFRRMLSNDMKENISGCVDIDDLEDDTVHRMLLYMYTDTLDDMQYENACKLYMAADKYEILSLRDSCSAFMKNNLCPNKACDALALADLHQDDSLKSFVQDFILKHDKEIFGSKEWKDFMDSNCKLASDVMYLFTLSKL